MPAAPNNSVDTPSPSQPGRNQPGGVAGVAGCIDGFCPYPMDLSMHAYIEDTQPSGVDPANAPSVARGA